MYNVFMWNWSKSTLCDDVVFIAPCIINIINNDIWWLAIKEQTSFSTHIQ
jgi:hypothetical protein